MRAFLIHVPNFTAGKIGTLGPLVATLLKESGRPAPDWDSVPGGDIFKTAAPYDPSSRPSPHTTPLAKFFFFNTAAPPSTLPLA